MFVIVSLFHLASADYLQSECLVHFKDGDLILGGIIPIYRTVNNPCDGPIMENHGVPKVEAMAYAVDIVNNRTDLLPNITLGYEIRNDCRTEDLSLWSMSTIAGLCRNETFHLVCPNHYRSHSRKVVGVIGPGSSGTSIFVAKLAAMYKVPMIAYSASSDELSNTNRFPYFFRTVAPDKFQVGAIMDLILYNNWKYIGLYFSIDTYGVHGAQQIRTLADTHDICIATSAPVPNNPNDSELQDIVNNLVDLPKVSVIVVFSLSVPAYSLLGAISAGNLSRRITFIASDGWGGSDVIDAGFGPLLLGSIFVRFYSPPDTQFRDYWKHLENKPHLVSPWYNDFSLHWKTIHNCSTMGSCPFPPASETFVINAVLAFAYALNDTLSQINTHNSYSDAYFGSFLRENLQQVSFPTADGTFQFDDKGDSEGKYKFLNLQMTNGKYTYKEVGLWDLHNSIYLQDDLIQWGPNPITDKTPQSVCKDNCMPGFIEVPLEEKCCWGCEECPNNAIVANKTICKTCPLKYWPNDNFTFCDPLHPVFLSLYNPTVIILMMTSTIGVLLTILTACGIWIYRTRPLIKATGRELSVMMICAVLLSFLTPFIKLTPPTNGSCILVENFISFSFLLNFAPTLLKVNRIYRIFRDRRRTVQRPKWLGPRDQILLLVIVVTFQVG